MSDLSRVEQLLRNALGEDIYEVTPQSRVEVLLAQLNELIEGMGGGSVSPEDIATAVAAYLDEHLTNPTSPPVDTSLAIAGAAADAKKTGDEISGLKSDLNTSVALTESEFYDAIDTYDDLLTVTQNTNFFVKQTEDTVVSGYIRNGVTVESDRFSHTNYIPVRANTEYTSCLVPTYGAATEPGYLCQTKAVFYDVNKQYIGESETTTFTTPINCKYIVLNLGYPGSIGLPVINNNTMLVLGNSVPSEYVSPTEKQYMDITGMFDTVNNEVANLGQITTENGDEYTALTPITSAEGIRVYSVVWSDNARRVTTRNDASQTCYVFAVSAGNKYKLYGFGYDRAAEFFVACFSRYNIVATGTTTIADEDSVAIACGTSEYPSGYTYHTITFSPTQDGFIYVNSRTAEATGAAWVANKTVKTTQSVKTAIDNTYKKHGLYKQGNTYYHFNKDGEHYIVRAFLRRGPNSLFQWNQILFGDIENDVLTITSSFSQFGTDIIGPISIWNATLFPNIYGQWTGGNHGKTIDGTEYATAEQVSFQCLVNGTEVTEDGMYYGDVRFNTVNKLYFAQSVTGADLSQSTQAILEHRSYYLDAQMHVRVWLEVLTDFRCAVYYGMQAVSRDFETVFCANNEFYTAFADLASEKRLDKPERLFTFRDDSGLHFDMVLDDVGLGTYTHNDGTIAYGFLPNPSVTRKAYYALIENSGQDLVAAGSNLMWEGTYRLYMSY